MTTSTPDCLPYARVPEPKGPAGTLLWFFGSGSACTVCLCVASAFLLGVWNVWLGPWGSFWVSVLIGEFAAALATLVLWLGLAVRGLRHRLSYGGDVRACVSGAVCALAALLPDVLDQYLGSGAVLQTGERASTGVGVLIGWSAVLISPLALSFLVARRRASA